MITARRFRGSGWLVVGCAAAGALAAPLSAQSPPSAPASITAVALSSRRVQVDWSPVTDAVGGVKFYVVRRGDGVQFQVNDTTHIDSTVVPQMGYTYTVWAVDSRDRAGDRSATVTVTTPPVDTTPPSTPQGLSATLVGLDQIDLAWTAAVDFESGVTGYNVYRDGTLITTVATPSFSDTGLAGNTTFTYEVAAVNGEGLEGNRSAPASATTLDTSPPSAPTGVSAQATAHDRVDLSWNAATDPESGVASYTIYRDGTAIGASSGTSFVDASVSAATTYSYEVAAVNGDGVEGPRSAAATVTTPAAPDTTPPSQPTGLSGQPTSATTIDLSWAAATDPQTGVSGYRIYRDGSVVGTSVGTSFTDTGLQASTTYSYEVSAVNGAGLEGPRSAAVSVTTQAAGDTSPPSAPGGLTATASGPTRVALSWTAAQDAESGISVYRVYRNGSQIGTSGTTDFEDDTAVAGTRYEYEVSAVNGAGIEGPRSATAVVTTPQARDTVPPAPPTRLRIVP